MKIIDFYEHLFCNDIRILKIRKGDDAIERYR